MNKLGEECISKYKNSSQPGQCNAVWDQLLCWKPTNPGETALKSCPEWQIGINKSQFAFRICLDNGQWAGKNGEPSSHYPNGWTNYTPCFTQVLKTMIAAKDLEDKVAIAEATRIVEMIGLTLSIISLLVSLIIYHKFKNLWNHRTRIHQNLFIAMSLQVIIRLVLYLDQIIYKSSDNRVGGITSQEYLCQSFYIILEYAKTAMFFWMLVEGLYLHNMITVAIFQELLSHRIYHIIGWGCPMSLTLVWSAFTAYYLKNITCWGNYNLSKCFWILEGPRLGVIILNSLFLLNIIRILITKMRESRSSEAQQVRKAVRAAVVLLPLLGITNFIQMVHTPMDGTFLEFAIWSFITTILTSFQGFFCAMIYSFLNKEVQLTIQRYFKRIRNHSTEQNREPFNPHNIFLHRSQEENLDRNARAQDTLRVKDINRELSSSHVDVEQIEIPAIYLKN